MLQAEARTYRIKSFLINFTWKGLTELGGAPQRHYLCITVIGLLFLTALGHWIGMPAVVADVNDPWLFADGGWRIFHGQTPHVDFYSHLGSSSFYLTALGFHLWGSDPASASLIMVWLGLLLGVLTAWVLFRRTSGGLAMLGTWSVCLVIASPRIIGMPSYITGQSMLYNRLGWGLVLLLQLILFLRPHSMSANAQPSARPRAGMRLDWVLAGLLLTCLAFGKVNFFAVGLGSVLLATVLSGRDWKMLMLMIGFSFLLSFGSLLKVSGIPVSAMLNDTWVVMQAQDTRGRMGLLVLQLFKLPFLVLGGIWLMAWVAHDRVEGQWRVLLTALYVSGSGLLLLATCGQKNDIPLLVVFSLALLEALRRHRSSTDSPFRWALQVGLGLSLFVLPMKADLFGYRSAAFTRMSDSAESLYPESPPRLRSLKLQYENGLGPETTALQGRMMEALELLARKNEPVQVISYANPFAFGLNRPPTSGGAVCWQFGIVFSPEHCPDEARVFAGRRLLVAQVLLPTFRKAYTNRLATAVILQEGKHWVLLDCPP